MWFSGLFGKAEIIFCLMELDGNQMRYIWKQGKKQMNGSWRRWLKMKCRENRRLAWQQRRCGGLLRHKKLLGVAWVVRNHRGVVISHSRRAFSNITQLQEVRFTTLGWAVENMTSMHYNKIIFAGDFKEFFLALKKPHEWPAMRYQGDELQRLLRLMEEYQLKCVKPKENRGTAFIAQSVTRQGRTRSYVANGNPEWLFEFFVNESCYL